MTVSTDKPLSEVLTPTEDRVIVKPVIQKEVTVGGLIIPQAAHEKPQTGDVLAAGPGRYEYGKWIDCTFSEGDTVLFGKFSGMEITYNGEKVLVMRASDILATVHPEGRGT